MDRDHLTIAYGIIIGALVLILGIMSYQAREYRLKKNKTLEAIELAVYTATSEMKYADEDGLGGNISGEFYKAYSALKDIDYNAALGECPALVVVDSDHYTIIHDNSLYSREKTPDFTTEMSLRVNEITGMKLIINEEHNVQTIDHGLLVIYKNPYNKYDNRYYLSMYSGSGNIGK